MNERIKQLAEQATTYIDPSANDGVCWDFDKEKFAELIVHDIINVLECEHSIRHVAYTTYDLGIVESTIEKSINAIIKHYGIKQHIRIKK